MLYQTVEFAVFYLIVFALYWIVARHLRLQNLLLLLAGYVFYAWWDWRFLGLLWALASLDFWIVRKMAASEGKSRRYWLWAGVGLLLGVLGIFKYYGFFADSLIGLFRALGYGLSERTTYILLPIGISFYIFQMLSYTIDVYRKRARPSEDYLTFLAYTSFFPQLIAGPIERQANLMPQFTQARTFDYAQAQEGLRQILWGLFKKVVIADNLSGAVEYIAPFPEAYRPVILLAGLFFFACQLYCDFSGYSDMAQGTARLLGFDLMRNFNFPYFARDILEFWRRWHISLTTWFRDYLFLPLSGGKAPENKAILIRNYLIVFTVSGLWHGANWTFVVWGLLHGLYHIPYVLFPGLRSQIQQTRPPFTLWGTLRAAGQILLTLGLNLLAIVFFMSPNLTHAFRYLKEMLSLQLLTHGLNQYEGEMAGVLLFFAVEWGLMYQKKQYPFQNSRWHPALRWSVYLLMCACILYYNFDRRAFIYFQF